MSSYKSAPIQQITNGILYLVGIGFTQPTNVKTKNSSKVALAYSYKGFDPEKVRSSIGKPSRHSADGVFVFRISAEQAIRVNTTKQTILLVSGRYAVRVLMEATKKNG